MNITRLKINYYKSIKEPMILELGSPAIFIGQNNSGKSNVLDAIEFALADSLQNDDIYYAKADIEIDLVFDDKEQDTNNFPEDRAKFVLKNQERKLIFGNKTIPYNKSLNILLSSKVKRLDEEAFNDYKQIELDYISLFNYPSNLDNFKKHLKDHFPKISATKNAMDVRYENEGLYEAERRVTIDRLGSGFRRIFTMLLYIFHPRYSIVMISEPETHLHPAMIKKLFWALQNSDFGQILFTTHSPLFVTPISLGKIIRIVKNEQNQTIAFSIDHQKYNYQRLIQELNADNLEMFFTDKVILVEGVSDRLLIRGLIDKFYQGQKDAKVIQTHGKGNMKLYVELLKIFKIPFMLVLDRDAIRTNHIREIVDYLEIKLPPLNDNELINALKEYDIYILSNGDLEANYPRRYQQHDSKSTNALRAANFITEEDYNSKTMAHLREVIENI